jgi:ankyrin repeat protein
MPITPLLLLLDGVLSQDEQRTREAVHQIQDSNIPGLPEEELPRLLSSASTLEQMVASLMKHRPEWAAVASARDGSLPLHFAASIGSIPLARLILDANLQAAATPNQKGKIPLHYAAREGRTDMVTFFVKQDPMTASILSTKDKLALHFAAGEGHFDVVRALLEAHPQGSKLASKKGKVAMHFAARWGHVHVARELLQYSPETISTLDYEGSSPLHDAAREGQTEMVKFLLKHWPEGLKQENLRGETPVFPAVRSGNLELVTYMIRAWPAGGRHVLQRVGQEDNVAGWAPQMLEVCLRGAVNVWQSSQDERDHEEASKAMNVESQTAFASPGSAFRSAASSSSFVNPPLEESPTSDESENGSLDIHLPRSKSPILSEAGQGHKASKRRSLVHVGEYPDKRSRSDHSYGREESLSELRAISEHRSFLELHAALECGASAPVLACILDRNGRSQGSTSDELGRLPLHVAMENAATQDKQEVVDLILKHIWKPMEAACFRRDFLGRLPLHVGLMNRADPKLINALLQSNPSSAVGHCEILDARFMYSSPLEMAIACRCPLSTIYVLVRADPSIVSTWS